MKRVWNTRIDRGWWLRAAAAMLAASGLAVSTPALAQVGTGTGGGVGTGGVGTGGAGATTRVPGAPGVGTGSPTGAGEAGWTPQTGYVGGSYSSVTAAPGTREMQPGTSANTGAAPGAQSGYATGANPPLGEAPDQGTGIVGGGTSGEPGYGRYGYAPGSTGQSAYGQYGYQPTEPGYGEANPDTGVGTLGGAGTGTLGGTGVGAMGGGVGLDRSTINQGMNP